MPVKLVVARGDPSWKDKILDYEIETNPKGCFYECRYIAVEKIRFSITRLKHESRREHQDRRLWVEKIRFSITRLKLVDKILVERVYVCWKDKILDYEIETVTWLNHADNIAIVEKIRFSITRLKLIRLSR